MNWRFCPHCETQLDEATGICPACRWDPLAEPPPPPPAPVVSLVERYRGTEHDGSRPQPGAVVQAHRTGPAPRAKLALIVGVLVLVGIYGGIVAVSQFKAAEHRASVTMPAP